MDTTLNGLSPYLLFYKSVDDLFKEKILPSVISYINIKYPDVVIDIEELFAFLNGKTEIQKLVTQSVKSEPIEETPLPLQPVNIDEKPIVSMELPSVPEEPTEIKSMTNTEITLSLPNDDTKPVPIITPKPIPKLVKKSNRKIPVGTVKKQPSKGPNVSANAKNVKSNLK